MSWMGHVESLWISPWQTSKRTKTSRSKGFSALDWGWGLFLSFFHLQSTDFGPIKPARLNLQVVDAQQRASSLKEKPHGRSVAPPQAAVAKDPTLLEVAQALKKAMQEESCGAMNSQEENVEGKKSSHMLPAQVTQQNVTISIFLSRC